MSSKRFLDQKYLQRSDQMPKPTKTLRLLGGFFVAYFADFAAALASSFRMRMALDLRWVAKAFSRLMAKRAFWDFRER